MGYLYVYPSDKPDETISLETAENKVTFKPLSNIFFALLNKMTFEKKGNRVEICGISQDEFKKTFSINGQGCTSV